MRNPFRSKLQITQAFGARPEYYKQFGLIGHEGLDLIPTGTDWTVYALEDGKVVKDEDNAKSGAYGINITLWHGKKATQYCHLEYNLVNLNDEVKKGQAIGKMGATGNTQGTHLHLNLFETDENGYRLNKDNGYFGGVNPEPFLNEDNTQQIIDELRAERDKNWGLHLEDQKKITELETKNQELQQQLQNLREAFDKQTQADADTGSQLLEAQHKATDLQTIVEATANALQCPATLKDILKAIDDLRKPHDTHVEEVIKTQNALAEAAISKRKVKQVSFLDKLIKFLNERRKHEQERRNEQSRLE